MGFISEVVPQISAAAVSRPPAPVSRAETAPNQNPVNSQPATVVSLSAESKSRSVSSGSNKFVDSSYGSEKYRTNKESDKSPNKEKTSINIIA